MKYPVTSNLEVGPGARCTFLLSSPVIFYLLVLSGKWAGQLPVHTASFLLRKRYISLPLIVLNLFWKMVRKKLNGLYERLTFCLIRSDRLKHKIVDLSCDKLRKNTDNFPKYLIEHCVQGKRVEAEPG